MTLTTEQPAGNGSIELIDSSDGSYAYGTNYVDLYVNIPPEGCNIPSLVWTIYVDGVYIDGGTQAMTFSSGPVNYYMHRTYVPLTGKQLVWNFGGGDTLGGPQEMDIALLVGQIPIAFVKSAGVWKHALPYVKSGGVWKQASPLVHTASGWSDTTG